MTGERGRVTLLDVARAAESSQTAVSYALNNRTGISDETRAHILATAERIGYQRRIPKSPSRGRVRNVAVALSPTRHRGDAPNYFVAELLAGVEAEAQQRRVRLDARFWTSTAHQAEQVGIDGTLFLGGAFEPEQIVAAAKPVVVVGTSFPSLNVDSVLADNYQGIYQATAHLLDVGCVRPMLFNGPASAVTTTTTKTAGFHDALRDRGLSADDAEVVNVEFDPSAGEARAREVLARATRPDGIVSGDDVIAIGILHAAVDLGIRVPEQLRLVGFGDSPTAELLRPSLSSVRLFLHQMGQIGLRRLVDRMDSPHDDLPTVRSMVSPRLIVRDTSGGTR